MKKLICFLSAAVLTLAGCCGIAEKHILVAYFSATGTTARVAEEIAQVLDADLYEIRPAEAYTADDLNWNDSGSRTTLEQNDDTARPALAEAVPDLSGYDTVLIGHPIWWGQAPKLIYTFAESAGLSGKTVTTFCTSASSGLGSSAENLKKSVSPSAVWLESRRFPAEAGQDEVCGWLKEIGLM